VRERLAELARTARAVLRELSRDDVPILSAALGFYALRALFPALLSVVVVSGVVADPGAIEGELAWLFELLPPSAASLVRGQLAELTAAAPTRLGVSLLLSLGVVLWSASTGLHALLKGISLAYFAEESRGFWRLRLHALVATVGVVLALTAGLLAVAAAPPVLAWLLPEGWLGPAIGALRWPALALAIAFGLELLYRHGPDREDEPPTPGLRGPSPGAWVATGTWLAASLAFSAFVNRFGTFNETYGTLGAGVVLLLWLYLGSFSALLGAELNAVLERANEPG